MSTHTRGGARSAWAAGGTLFAATVLVVLGIWSFFVGLAAILTSQFFVVLPNYVYAFSTTSWGWIHLVVGILLVIVGICLFMGQTWARVAGVILASISAVLNFLFMPYYPLWSIVLIAVDIFVIWALLTVRREEIS
ncbi:DUF7144 family membrane protein [Sinosporangium siamense]|uniref:DUF7144 domain-containing protein n=1 Tax=Sinosporangium siamense TaxID=1367973 RepID=A0A919RP73_9ACTN|nr:hypothetical protein [Sinosporangium siamense]GII97318.1 hypothetical protein Ssi02_75490 [Sinosporangium siamense]